MPPLRSPVCSCSSVVLVSVLLSLYAAASTAQEPLRNELAVVLAADSARAAAPAHGVPQALHALYDPAGAPLLWSTAGQLTSQAQVLLRELGAADAYGLEPRDYVIADTVNLVPAEGTSSPVALAIAAISMADLVPSRNELNICGFIPADCASSAESP